MKDPLKSRILKMTSWERSAIVFFLGFWSFLKWAKGRTIPLSSNQFFNCSLVAWTWILKTSIVSAVIWLWMVLWTLSLVWLALCLQKFQTSSGSGGEPVSTSSHFFGSPCPGQVGMSSSSSEGFSFLPHRGHVLTAPGRVNFTFLIVPSWVLMSPNEGR